MQHLSAAQRSGRRAYPEPDLSRRRFESKKSHQLFIRTHNVTLAAIDAIMVSIFRSIGGYKPPFPIPKTRLAFRQHAQQTAFRRRDARQQSLVALPVASMQFPHRSTLTFLDKSGLSENHQGGKTGGVRDGR
jgi:hypothetical protein